MSDFTPTVSREDIDRIAERDYPQCSVEEIWDILKTYGHGEAYRIYAAALKEGKGNKERLKEMIELANLDYRDLIVAAEYPDQMKEGFGYHKPETFKADEKQYYDWFNE